jgi:tetratricopeptide (TPR) repeat protein
MFEDLGLALRAAWVSDTLGAIELLAGDAVGAEREYRAGYEAAERLGDHGYRATIGASLAHALIEQGRDQEALGLADLTASTAGEDDLASQVLWRGARARAIASGDPAEASRLAREAVELSNRTDDVNMQADALVDLGVVLDRSGEADAAAEAFVLALERYEAKGNRAAADRLRARTALGIG